MKINLVRKLDSTLLDMALENFNYKYSKFPKYIIMNEETFLVFLKDTPHKYVLEINYNNQEEPYYTYDHFPIAICNFFDYGEIEII